MKKKSTQIRFRPKDTRVKIATPGRARHFVEKPAATTEDVIRDYRGEYGSYAAYWKKIIDSEKESIARQRCVMDNTPIQLRRIQA